MAIKLVLGNVDWNERGGAEIPFGQWIDLQGKPWLECLGDVHGNGPDDYALAELICRAVNSHEALVAALSNLLAAEKSGFDPYLERARLEAIAALKLARGES